MNSRLAVDLMSTDRVGYVKLSGHIDEDNELIDLTKKIPQSLVVLNTANVERINSCGVRDWVSWLNQLDRQGARLYLTECSPAIMTQVNLVNNFVGSGAILSFYAPYFCPGCDSEKMLLIKTQEALENLPFRAPTCRCDQCDHTMDFDDIESSYFAFLSAVEAVDPGADVAEAVEQFGTDADGMLRTRTTSMAVLPGAGTTAGGFSAHSHHTMPTTPGSRDLKSLISESISFGHPDFSDNKAASQTNTILYLVIGLLVVAIALLGYVVVRAF